MPKSASEKQIGGDHYKKYKIQPGYFCEVNHLDGYESAAIAYIVRHQDKGGVEDLDKAIHCLELIKEIKYPESPTQSEMLFDNLDDDTVINNAENIFGEDGQLRRL